MQKGIIGSSTSEDTLELCPSWLGLSVGREKRYKGLPFFPPHDVISISVSLHKSCYIQLCQ